MYIISNFCIKLTTVLCIMLRNKVFIKQNNEKKNNNLNCCY